MASLHSIPRFLLPRGPLLLRNPASIAALPLWTLRHASTLPPRSKTLAEQLKEGKRVLPQPDKYRPPSHGRRAPRSSESNLQKSYGPKLSEEDRKRMATKKYPNMMAPKGTFAHWFFHDKFIHIWITFGILISLAIAAWYMDFVHTTIYRDLLPQWQDFKSHPIQSTKRWIEVYKMDVEHKSEIYRAQQNKRFEDVQKRKQFRLQLIREAEERGEEYVEDPRYYVDEEGVRRRRVKKWLGIWE